MKTNIIAHRGASADYPENTMIAFRKAIELKVDAIEFDVHMSKDGEIFVIHDAFLERTTNGTGLVCEHTKNEILKLRADKLIPQNEWVGVPTFKEALLLIKDTNMWISIELKFASIPYPNYEERIIEIIYDCGMQDRVILTSFNHYSLKKIKEISPGITTGPIHVAAIFEPHIYAKKLGASAMHPLYNVIFQPGWVDMCHKNGILVNTWVADEEQLVMDLIKMNVDGVITNRPDVGMAAREKWYNNVDA